MYRMYSEKSSRLYFIWFGVYKACYRSSCTINNACVCIMYVCVLCLEFFSGKAGFWLAYTNFKCMYFGVCTMFAGDGSIFLFRSSYVFWWLCLRSIFIARQANFSGRFLFVQLWLRKSSKRTPLRMCVRYIRPNHTPYRTTYHNISQHATLLNCSWSVCC